MKTIKTERVYFNRFNVAIAVCEVDVEHIDGYDHAEDMEIVEGHVEVGMPRNEIDAVVRNAKRENEAEEKHAKMEVARKEREAEKAKWRAKVEQEIVNMIVHAGSGSGWDDGQATHKGLKAHFESGWAVAVEGDTFPVQKVRVHIEDGTYRRPCVEVGDYGDVSRFPQLKDGSFSYGKIAVAIIVRAAAEHRAKLRLSKEQGNKLVGQVIVEALRERHGLDEYITSAVKVESVTYAPDLVKVGINLELNAEEADELLAAARKIVAERDARREVTKALEAHLVAVEAGQIN